MNTEPQPGRQVRWSNTPANGKQAIQSGQAVADQHGLITLEQVRVSKGQNRIRVFARSAGLEP